MKKKKLLPVPVLVIIDVLLIGICLCVYALFHHVLPAWGFSTYQPVTPVAVSTPAPTPTPIASAAPAETEEPVEEVPIDYGQFGEKFQDKFTTDGEIIQTENLYVSENVRVELINDRMFNSDVHIIDIYVRNIENLRTTFANGDEVFDGTRATVVDMAERVNAVAAINGDYCGFIQGGEYVVFRNGLYFYSNPTRAVCVLYNDGTMKTFWKPYNQTGDDFDLEAEMQAGAWQMWSFGPALLDGEGHALDLYYDPNQPRSMIGYYEPGHYCFVTVEGRSNTNIGVTLTELASIAETLGCSVAFNLDGGGSSTLTFGGELVSIGSPNEGLREITDTIYIVDTLPGEDSTVQTEEDAQ